MIIYFVANKVGVRSPGSLILPAGEKLRRGDVCVVCDKLVVCVYVLKNVNAGWPEQSLISIRPGNTDAGGNKILYSFDGISCRRGNVEILTLLKVQFSDTIIGELFEEAIEILLYKKDLIDVGVLKKLYISNGLEGAKVAQPSQRRIVEKSVESNELTPFVSFLPEALQEKFKEMLVKSDFREVVRNIRRDNPREFREAFKKFTDMYPTGSIYDNLKN